MDLEFINLIIQYAGDTWPVIVSIGAGIGGTTVGILNILKLKKIRLEIGKLEKEKSKKLPSLIELPTDDEILKYGKSNIRPEIEWPKKN